MVRLDYVVGCFVVRLRKKVIISEKYEQNNEKKVKMKIIYKCSRRLLHIIKLVIQRAEKQISSSAVEA